MLLHTVHGVCTCEVKKEVSVTFYSHSFRYEVYNAFGRELLLQVRHVFLNEVKKQLNELAETMPRQEQEVGNVESIFLAFVFRWRSVRCRSS